MSTAVEVVEPRLLDVRVTDAEIIAYLADGRTIRSLCVVMRLSEATPEERSHCYPDGDELRWPDIGRYECGRHVHGTLLQAGRPRDVDAATAS